VKVEKVVLLLIAMMAVSNARTMQVGGRGLEIPGPEGYVEVTPEMPGLYGATRSIVDPDKEILAYYIPAEMAERARSDEAPRLEKYFVLKVQGNTQFVTLDSGGFEGLVAGVRSTNQMVAEEMKSELGDSFDPAAVVALKGVALLPPHQATEDIFAYSMLINTAPPGGKGNKQVMSATTSYANVGGKVLLFYAFGPEKDLVWTQTETAKWTDSVLEINPKPPAGPPRENGGRMDSGEDDGAVLKSGLIGAAAGGILVFLLFLVKNRKKG
jgi:hypothetical protein